MKTFKIKPFENSAAPKNITMKVMRTLEEEMYNNVRTKYDVG